MKKIYLFLVAILTAWLSFANARLVDISSLSRTLDNTVKNQKTEKPKAKIIVKKIRKQVIPYTGYQALTPEETMLYSTVLVPSITATKTVAVQGGGSAVPGSQLNYTIVVNNAGTDATAVSVNDVLINDLTLVAGTVTSTPIAINDSYSVVGNVGIVINAASGILTNDVSPTNTAKAATVVASGTSTNGTYTIAADGSFTYTPTAGYTGSDSFTYTVNTGTTSSTGTVNITVAGMIWFVNTAAASSGTGTLASPFKAISNITGTSAGNTVFLYAGTYTGSLTLLGTQKLIGQGAVASLATITGLTFTNAPATLPVTGGTNPTWNTAALTLGSGNDVQGINLNSTTGTTMTGVSVGALKVRDVSLNNTAGQALQITAGGALDVQFKSISAAGAGKGLSVNSSTGNFQVLGTSTTTGSGGTISNITNRGVEFISASNIILKNMTFTNANTADGTIASQTDNTGANAGIFMDNITGATLDNIQMNTTTGNANAQMGINLNDVSNFVLKNSTITRCGTTNEHEACIYAVNTTGTGNIIENSTLSKASRITRFSNTNTNMSLKVTGSSFNDTRTEHDNTTLNANGQSGILYQGLGSSIMNLDVKSSCNFLRIATQGVNVTADNSAQMNADVLNSTFNSTNAALPLGEDVGLGVLMEGSGSSIIKFNINGNTITGRGGPLIGLGTLIGSTTRLEGTVDGNTLNFNFISAINNNAGVGINVGHLSTNTTSRVKINNNTLTNFATQGIDVGTAGAGGRLDAIVTNNNISIVTSNYGIGNAVLPPAYTMLIGSNLVSTVCSKVANNTVNAAGTIGVARIRASGASGADVHLVEGSGNGSDNINALETIWNNLRTTGTIATAGQIVKSGVGTHTLVAVGTCQAPANPPINLSVSPPSGEQLVESQEEPADKSEEETEIVNSEETEAKPSTESTNSSAKIAAPLSGETITVNGSGAGFSLPASKSTTITFSATVSSTPITCPINNQASVSGSNFTTVNSNITTTNLIVSPPTGVTGAMSVCNGQSVSLSATCAFGTVQWYSGATLLGTSVSLGTFNHSPASNTVYEATCKLSGCESTRIQSGVITVNSSPTASPSSNTPVCVGNTLNLTSTTATSYLWGGPNGFSSTVQNPSVSNVSILAGTAPYTLRITNASGCTATATTAVVINSTQSPTAPTATPSSRTTLGSSTLSATGCSGGTLTWFNAATNVAVPSPNNQPNFTAQGTFNFYAKCTGTNTCVSDASVNVPVTVTLCTPLGASPGNVGINWTGLVSTDWNTACNWSPAWVPDGTNSEVVIGLQTNQPTITGTVPTVKTIYLNANAVLTVNSGGTLTVSGSTGINLQGAGASVINDGTINTGTGGGHGFFGGVISTITNRGTINTNNEDGVTLNSGTLTFTNEATGIFNGRFTSGSTGVLNLTNRGTINYAGTISAFELNSVSSVSNSGTISITGGSGILNPSGSIITNNACGKILMTAGAYQNGGTTTNVGLIQMPNTYDFTNTGTFTNNAVVKANTVASITNNRMVITNACPIFTLGGTNNYTVSGIFTNAGATTSAGTYVSVGNKFTANNIIPTGTQTLYAQVTNGTCTFVVPFDFNNVKPTAVSVNNITVCPSGNVTLSGTCASGTLTWYTTATGGTSIGTGTGLSNSPTAATTYYAACESGTPPGTNCVSGRVATSEVTIASPSTASATPTTQTICSGGAITTIAITGTGTSYTWTRDNTVSVTGISASGSGNISGSLTNTTEAPITVTFTITPIANGCNGTEITATVVVNPIPTVTASTPSQSICSGQFITGISFNNPAPFGPSTANLSTDIVPTAKPEKVQQIVLSSFVAGTVLNWTRDNTATVTGISASGSGNISGSLTNTTASPVTVTFTITPSYTNAGKTCDGTPITVTVTVNPNPASATITDAGTSFCSGSSTTLSAPADPNYTYAWERSLTGINNEFTAFGGTAQTQVITTSGVYRVIVTNQYNCSARDTTAVKFGDFVFSGSLGAGDATQTGRMNRLAVASTCAAPKSYPGDFTTSDARFYDSYTITNPKNTPVCATIGLSSGCGTNIFSATYLNSFSPTALSSNYLADAGTSFSLTGFYEATIPANGTIVVVVHVRDPNSSCAGYNLRVDVPGATTPLTASSNAPICEGNTLNLTGSGTGSGTPPAYSWTGPNSFTSTDQNPSIANATTLATGTYTISVTNANNCVFNATTVVTVNENPTATASSNSPVCAGTTLNLTGGGIGTYSWTSSNGFTSTAQSPTISNATVSATGTYTITVTNVNGCTSTASVAVTVNPLPVVDAGANQTICEGSTASLTAICNLLTVSTTLSGTSEVPANASTATGTVSGTFDKVTKQLLLTISFNELTANASAAHIHKAAVGVNGGVVIGFSGVPAAASGSFTYTGTLTTTQEADLLAGLYYVNVHNASFPGGEIRGQLSTACVANSYTWNPGNLSGQTVTVSPSTTQLYTLTASNSTTGCSSTATTTINVNPRPVVTIGSNTPVCVGNTLNLTSSGGTSYAWTGINSFISSAQNSDISNVTILASGTYGVTVANANGCTNTATTSVVINALPTATASNNSPICSGVTLNLTGGGVGSYSWTSSTGYTSTAQSPSIPSATASMSGTYTIAVTNTNGCTSTATTSVTVNPVTATPTPQANTQIIFGGSITLTATGCSGVNDVLKWYKSSDNALATMPVSPTTTTNFYAKCETTLNAITCISGNSVDVTVTVLQPNPPVATGATNCIGTPTALTATGCSGSVGTFVLKWYQNSDDALVTMPVSPLVSTDYYAKCEQTFNSVTAVSAKSSVVTLTILNPLAPVATGGTIYLGNPISLTATGCTGVGFTIKWYQTSDNMVVTMPVSPTVTTQYYAKCEQIANSATCLSPKSNDVTVTVVNRIFVDISKIIAPIQNGNSWATAYGNLQTGLAAATAGVEVWVAKGTYKPTNTTTRTIYFNIPNNVIVYGGFAGIEDNLIDRNFRTNVSILSGDIGVQNSMSDNSYHVVTFSGSSVTTILDGFTITNGNASFDPKINGNNNFGSGGLPAQTGGGILIDNAGMPIIANCTIIKNAAWFGGGIYCLDSSTPTIRECDISNNEATFGSAIYAQTTSNFTMNNVLMSANRALGTIYNNSSSPVLTNCTIASNGGFSGGIYNANVSQPIIKNSILWGNASPFNDTQSIITYSIIQSGYSGVGNLTIDPQLVNPAAFSPAPNTTGDYRLKAASLSIDRGSNGTISLTDKDLDGNLRRFAGGVVDMGAYEFQGVATSTLVISVVTGPWEANSTWNVGRVPQLGDYVIIDNNHIVTLSGTGIAKNLEYRGTGQLKFNTATSKIEIGF